MSRSCKVWLLLRSLLCFTNYARVCDVVVDYARVCDVVAMFCQFDYHSCVVVDYATACDVVSICQFQYQSCVWIVCLVHQYESLLLLFWECSWLHCWWYFKAHISSPYEIYNFFFDFVTTWASFMHVVYLVVCSFAR